jgi:hypothetical protein
VTPATLEIHPEATTSGKPSAPIGLTPPATNPGARPPLFVARDELFYWTRDWQAGERESAEQRAAGHLRAFDSGADLLEWLKSTED